MTLVADTLARFKKLESARGQWETHWQALAEVMHWRRAAFTASGMTHGGAAGSRRNRRIYDSTPMLARRSLSAALDSLLKPKTQQWFNIRPRDPALAEDDAVKRWVEAAEERLFEAIYDREAGFVRASREIDDDLVTFGTGVLFIGENETLDAFRFLALDLKDVFIAQGGDGRVDTVFVRRKKTARQAVQAHGEKNVSRDIREAANGQNGQDADKEFKFLWVVMPRRERDPRRGDNLNQPFASMIIEVGSETVVEQSGFHEFPFAIPRWDTSAGELYGRGPGMVALGDSNSLQAMGKTFLIAGQKAADPPLLVSDDALVSAPRTFPGGITYFDAETARDFGGRPPITPLQTGANLPLTREMQQDTRDQIWQAFFRDVLRLPVAGPRMTAFEVARRREDFVRTIGPVFGQLEADYIGVVAERCFAIMLRAGVFDEVPDVLVGQSIRFTYRSPVEQARKQIEAAGAAQGFQLLAPLAEAQPEILDNFDGDAMARDTPDSFGIPQDWIRPLAERDAIREQRARQAADRRQAQTLIEAAGGAANAGAAMERFARAGSAASESQ